MVQIPENCVTLLAVFASALINNDASGLDSSQLAILPELAQYGYPVNCGDPYYGQCEHTGTLGMVAEFNFHDNGGKRHEDI